MPATGAIRVEGLTELVDGFKHADRELGREVRGALKDTGEVVKVDAQGRAAHNIRNMTPQWSRMRLGITGGNIVYVVPGSRRRPGGSRRPNLAGLLGAQMQAAADANRALVAVEVEKALLNLHQNAGLIKSLHNI